MSLILRGVDFGPVQCASGAMGWFGEGYWYHKYIPGLSWKGCTFVAKTTTLMPRAGNMVLDRRGRSKEWMPKCIVVNMRKGVVLNSVGLSGPGAAELFKQGRWQKRTEPFFLSFMSVDPDPDMRVQESLFFNELMRSFLNGKAFKAPVGIQVNLSCPNTGHDPKELAGEARKILYSFQDIRQRFNVPIVPKLNVLYPVEALPEIEDLIDGICTTNTIPWGQLPGDIDWHGLFPTPGSGYDPISPLAHLGGGGLSGWPLLSLVKEWVQAARGRGYTGPINAGGGILSPADVDTLAAAGADSVFMGSIAILRGWRLRKTIKRAHEVLR